MLEGNEVSHSTSSQKNILTYCDEEIIIIFINMTSDNIEN